MHNETCMNRPVFSEDGTPAVGYRQAYSRTRIDWCQAKLKLSTGAEPQHAKQGIEY